MMPFKSKRELPEEIPLTDAERRLRIAKLQCEQERRLRRALDDGLFEWIEDFEQDADVLTQD